VAGIIASTLTAALATSSHGDAAALAEAPPHEGVSPDGRFSPGLHVPVDEPLADRLWNAHSITSPAMSSDTSRDPRSAGLKATTGDR